MSFEQFSSLITNTTEIVMVAVAFISMLFVGIQTYLLVKTYEVATKYLTKHRDELNQERSLKNSEKLYFQLVSLKRLIDQLLAPQFNVREVKSFSNEIIYKWEYQMNPAILPFSNIEPYQIVQVMNDRLDLYLPRIKDNLNEIELVLTFNTFSEYEPKMNELNRRLEYWKSQKNPDVMDILAAFSSDKEPSEEVKSGPIISCLSRLKNVPGEYFEEEFSSTGITSLINEFLQEIKRASIGLKKRP